MDKTTVVDIARAADVSRSTVYEYFRDKAEIVEACAEHSSQKFYREMTKAMSRGESLEDKLTLAAVFVTKARRFMHSPTPIAIHTHHGRKAPVSSAAQRACGTGTLAGCSP